MMMENETISMESHDNIVNEIFNLRNLGLIRIKDLLERGDIEGALKVISYYKLD
jgi:hypothetical protein